MPPANRAIAAAALMLALAVPCAAQSRRGELRGVWMEPGPPRDWPAIMRLLKENGFNAVFPKFSAGNMARFPSEVLTDWRIAGLARDELAEAAKAARENGIELHVWRISWALWLTPPELRDQLDEAGRLQRSSRGQRGADDPAVGTDWLCPSNPQNRKLEKEAMLEMVRSYDIAGIQFDDMRFPSGDYCFCDHCREQFQKDANVHVEHWPDDVLEGGPHVARWRQWRREMQSTLVEEISEEAHRIKPSICVSLAAWPDPEDAKERLGQDWPVWVKEGALDFVCPEDYTADRQDLSQKLAAQLEATRGAVPLYAGLGASMMDSAGALIDQVETAREAGADGFVAFAYDGGGRLAEWLPQLRATVTASSPDPMPHWGPPARFGFSGAAVGQELAPALRVISGADLEVELAVGSEPSPQSRAEEESGGAAEAANVLRRATETRSPITTYEQTPDLMSDRSDATRLSGRILVETPSGLGLIALGAFDTDYRVERKTLFSAPEGAFRIAIYGARRVGEKEPRDFVVRSPLLMGVRKEQLEGEGVHAELDRFWAEACAHFDAKQRAGIDATLQIEAAGPGGGRWWLRFRDGECESGAGQAEDADVTVTASPEDLLAIARGESNPRALWEAGRLRASGDPVLLRELAAVVAEVWATRSATGSF